MNNETNNNQQNQGVGQVVQPTPVAPAQPAVQPAPVAPAQPAVQPAPVAPAQPAVQPAPVAPTQPTVQPAPVAPTQPTVQPAPQQNMIGGSVISNNVGQPASASTSIENPDGTITEEKKLITPKLIGMFIAIVVLAIIFVFLLLKK